MCWCPTADVSCLSAVCITVVRWQLDYKRGILASVVLEAMPQQHLSGPDFSDQTQPNDCRLPDVAHHFAQALNLSTLAIDSRGRGTRASSKLSAIASPGLALNCSAEVCLCFAGASCGIEEVPGYTASEAARLTSSPTCDNNLASIMCSDRQHMLVQMLRTFRQPWTMWGHSEIDMRQASWATALEAPLPSCTQPSWAASLRCG